MKIYFACSISGGRQDEAIYQDMVQLLISAGIEVPNAHIAETGIEVIDEFTDAREVYQRDVDWIRESDLLVAEVSRPSHGVGYEIGFALDQEIPVLCLHKQESVVSKMITGNPHPLLTVASYREWREAEELLLAFVKPWLDSLEG